MYLYKNIPAPGLPRVCFGIFLRVFMMTFMFISWYLQDFWSNHHHDWSENVANSIVFYLFIIFHLYLHAFVNARSRKRLFQDALFFDGFAFRHRERTKKRTFRFFSGAAMCGSAREETGSVASGMCASARDEVGSVASAMCASAREETGSVASRMCAIERY